MSVVIMHMVLLAVLVPEVSGMKRWALGDPLEDLPTKRSRLEAAAARVVKARDFPCPAVVWHHAA